ncbi:gametocyte-specific factor 1-like [Maniola jurtina]|uniref:gametocyte-specific factor 1-like n=1 Tax=Maniola jurtina TaxID=191418 RepID=UPI001E689B45|nr:gametocyte-specific factor 1-like [Maniola jurtina]
MTTPAPHQLVTCPFNKSHQIEHYRMHVHLQKCSKQHKNLKYSTCPLDATHIVLDAQLDHHVANCPKSVMFHSKIYIMDNDHRPIVPVQRPQPVEDCEEDWESSNVSSYVPDPAKKGPHIINKIKGATPSERRKARMQGIQTYKPPQ